MHDDITAAGKSPGRMLFAHKDRPAAAPLKEICGKIIKRINIAARAAFVKKDFFIIYQACAYIINKKICEGFMKHVKKLTAVFIVLAVLINFQVSFLNKNEHILYNTSIDNGKFAAMQLNVTGTAVAENAERLSLEKGEMLLIALLMNNYNIDDSVLEGLHKNICIRNRNRLMQFNSLEFAFYKNVLNGLYSEMEYFPVARSLNRNSWVNYVNSWGYERTYGGERRHEGTDIMSDENEAGVMPVVSVCNGKVANIGWLELGGYRVGILSDSNIYYYYAHLDSFAEGLSEGDTVAAGQLLGYMGDTGYSKIEGTRGKFDVHLHFGIYITKDGEERAINPYYLLKNISNKILYYQY